MDIQNMLRQAQKIQQDMLKIKKEIEEKIFPGKYSNIEVEVNGKKELVRVKIDRNFNLEKDDFEMLEDMIVVAVNDAMKKLIRKLKRKWANLEIYQDCFEVLIMIYPSSIEKLIESFKELPGIGDKTAERLAFSIMDLEDEK